MSGNPYGLDDPRRIEQGKGCFPFLAVIFIGAIGAAIVGLVRAVTGA